MQTDLTTEQELTQDQLRGLINLLKESLTFFYNQNKIKFLNDWCMYLHIRDYAIPKKGKMRFNTNIGSILDILEPYIPFRLTEENFDLFMDAVFLPEEISEEINMKLSHKSKMDFCLSLRALRDNDDWSQMLSTCETIRALRVLT